MAEGKSLKDQNAPLIRAVLVVHLFALIWLTLLPIDLLSLDLSSIVARLEAVAAPGTISLSLVLVASLLVLGLLPPNWRDRIIHWRWRHPLPGARAFSRIGPECSRVDMNVLAQRRGPLPTESGEQSRLFYSIYLEFSDASGVLDSHRRYLATRDIGTINAILVAPMPSLAWLISGNWLPAAGYAGLLFAAYVLCAIAAQNYAVRLVQNVLSLASCCPLTSDGNTR